MMQKKTVRLISSIIAAVLVIAMIFSIVASGISFAGAATSKELKSKLDDLEEQRSAVRAEINELDKKVASVEETRAALQKEINLTKQEIQTVEDYIGRLTGQITIKQGEVKVAEEKLEEKDDLFRERIRVMYENGETSYLDVVLNAKSFSDMLSRIDIVSQIMAYDKRVVAEYKAAKEDIEQKRDELQKTKDEQVAYQTNLEYKKNELVHSEAQQAALQKSLESYQQEKRAESEKLENQMKEVNDQIAEMSRKEAEAAARSSGGSNGGNGGTRYSGTFVWPTPGWTGISSSYGYRTHPIFGYTKFHAGEDIPAPTGTSIVAAASGTVVTAGWVSGYGNYTVINHGGGVMTAYGHQSAIYVSVGQTVSQGETIGAVGTTGNSTGPHLHFEVYVNGSTQNPMAYFT